MNIAVFKTLIFLKISAKYLEPAFKKKFKEICLFGVTWFEFHQNF